MTLKHIFIKSHDTFFSSLGWVPMTSYPPAAAPTPPCQIFKPTGTHQSKCSPTPVFERGRKQALTVPPMRKSSPATYCMRSCCWQHPSTPMIQPKRMMDTAMPTKPAVILLRSASERREWCRSHVEKSNHKTLFGTKDS